MDSKYTPGEGHIVDEITNRFLEKERANTSLLRYLHEQQAEMFDMDEEMKRNVQQKRELNEHQHHAVLHPARGRGDARGEFRAGAPKPGAAYRLIGLMERWRARNK